MNNDIHLINFAAQYRGVEIVALRLLVASMLVGSLGVPDTP